MIKIKYVCSNGEEYNLIGEQNETDLRIFPFLRVESKHDRTKNGRNGKFFYKKIRQFMKLL